MSFIIMSFKRVTATAHPAAQCKLNNLCIQPIWIKKKNPLDSIYSVHVYSLFLKKNTQEKVKVICNLLFKSTTSYIGVAETVGLVQTSFSLKPEQTKKQNTVRGGVVAQW